MNCPNCQAASDKQRILIEGKRQCTICATIWTITEHGPVIKKEGQAFLAEIAPGAKLIQNKGRKTMQRCIVLNQDMTILGTTTYKRAIKLIVKGRAEVLAESDRMVHPTMYIPKVIRLIKAIRNLWRTSVPWSKQNVHVRDLFRCQYCGEYISKNKVTIDHVIPVAQGGKNKWENTVCSCFNCNNTKEDRTPSQAHMSLLRQPYQPTIMEFMLRKIKSEGLDRTLKDLGIY